MRFTGLLRAAQAAVSTNAAPKSVSSSTGKPQLRNWLSDYATNHAVIAFLLAISAGMAYRYFIGEPRKHKYAEFWRTYDEHADMKRMVKAGLYDEIITIEDFEAMEQEELKKLKAQYGKK